MEYAIQLTKAANAHLAGVFPDEFIYRSCNVYKVLTTYENYEAVMKGLDAKDKKKRNEEPDIEFSGVMKDPWRNHKAGFMVNGKINPKDCASVAKCDW